jgi:tetratricopeptide (TPR) repeat protein
MLQDKLEQASQEAKRKRIKVAISLFATVTMLALLLLGVIKIDLTFFGPTQELNEQVSLTTGMATPAQPSKNTTSEAHPNQRNQKIVSTRPINQNPSLLSIDAPRISKLRDAFKRDLFEFEDGIEPLILSKGFANWNFERQQQILTKKGEAVSSFSLGDYEQALIKLEEADQNSRAQIIKLNADFMENILKARSLYDVDDYNAASLNISNALRLKPLSVEAQELKEKIFRLPIVLENIQKATVARTENNLELEVKYLKEAIDTDPSRNELSDRLGVVEEEILELHFSQLINSGLVSVDQKDLVAAQRHLKNATSIFKERSEVELLSRKVKALAFDLEVEKLVKEARSKSESDNWSMTETLYQKAVKIQPNRKDVVDGYALAGKINALSRKLSYHLQSPYRLSSVNVAENARILVAEAATVSAKSRLLADQTTKLLELLKAYSTKVSIKIISDGVTNISVRGVGKVGLTNEKTIDLRPGKYTFEGKRIGYRSKLIQVEVPPNSGNLVVEIFTDERI